MACICGVGPDGIQSPEIKQVAVCIPDGQLNSIQSITLINKLRCCIRDGGGIDLCIIHPCKSGEFNFDHKGRTDPGLEFRGALARVALAVRDKVGRSGCCRSILPVGPAISKEGQGNVPGVCEFTHQEVTHGQGACIIDHDRCLPVVDGDTSQSGPGEGEFRFEVRNRAFVQGDISCKPFNSGGLVEDHIDVIPTVEREDVRTGSDTGVDQPGGRTLHREVQGEGFVPGPRGNCALFRGGIDVVEALRLEGDGNLTPREAVARFLNHVAEPPGPRLPDPGRQEEGFLITGLLKALNLTGQNQVRIIPLGVPPYHPGFVVTCGGNVDQFHFLRNSDSRDQGINRDGSADNRNRDTIDSHGELVVLIKN